MWLITRYGFFSIVEKPGDKAKACLKIDKTKGVLRIDGNYEARVHVIANIDAVVVFSDNFVEIQIPGAGG